MARKIKKTQKPIGNQKKPLKSKISKPSANQKTSASPVKKETNSSIPAHTKAQTDLKVMAVEKNPTPKSASKQNKPTNVKVPKSRVNPKASVSPTEEKIQLRTTKTKTNIKTIVGVDTAHKKPGKEKKPPKVKLSKSAENSITHTKPTEKIADSSLSSNTKTKKTLNVDLVVSSSCALGMEQVEKAVNAAFEAYEATQSKTSLKLFESDPEPVKLLVSAIKIPPHKLLKVKLPNPFLSEESDICLIVKDLQKGWRVDHEPTIHHYQELLQNSNISYINEIMPLRQLRVEYKPYEAKAKLARRFDCMLVDKRIAKHVPRYLGGSVYESGNVPLLFNVEADNLESEIKEALSTTILPITSDGVSTLVHVGLSTQSAKELSENIFAAYKEIEKSFPGGFANVRNLNICFGNSQLTVPIYVSYATRDTVTLPKLPKKNVPVVDELTTLPPGWKVAVYPDGTVKTIKDKKYKRTAIDATLKSVETLEEEISDDEEDSECDKDTKNNDESKKPPKKLKKTAKGGSDKKKPENKKNAVKATKGKKNAEESSEDEGDAFEEEYMKELDMIEEEVGDQEQQKDESTETEPNSKGNPKISKKKKRKV